jgi:DHHC palmitoyltransferase
VPHLPSTMDAATGVLIFLGVYLFFILLLSYTILFGGSPSFSTTCIGRMHTFLTETLSASLQKCVGRICCPRAAEPTSRAAEACDAALAFFEKRVMPFVYLGLLAAGLATAKAIIVPRLADLNPPGEMCPESRLACVPGLPLTLPPTTAPSALWGWGVIAFLSWFRIYSADPGIVTAENFEVFKQVYPYDGVLFVMGNECETCKRPKLPRAKHDRTIGKCVLRYDHYCGWTGNVIGLYNTGRFILFLMVHFAMLSHGAMLVMEIVWARMLVFIKGNYTYTPTNMKITGFSARVALTVEPTLCMFLFVILVSIGVVGGFLGYHAYLVANNTTTSETFKWKPVNEACQVYKEENFGRSYGDKLRDDVVRRAEGDKNVLLRDLPEFLPNGLARNIYDRGVLSNFFEVAFPRVFVEAGPARNAERNKNE